MTAKVICRITADCLEPEWPLIQTRVEAGFGSFHEVVEVEFESVPLVHADAIPSMCFELVSSSLKKPELEVVRANLVNIMQRHADDQYAKEWLVWAKGFRRIPRIRERVRTEDYWPDDTNSPIRRSQQTG